MKTDLATQRSVVVEKRAAPSPAPKPKPKPPAPNKPRVCGPDVDSQLTKVLNEVETYYMGLSFPEQYLSCNAITIPPFAFMAWDIHQLFLPHTGWLSNTPFLGKCGIPHGGANVESPIACSNSVRTGGKCNLAGTVNYSLLGMIARLCGPYTPRPIGRAMVRFLVEAWKTFEGTGDDPGPPTEFALAVYDGGASARPTTENRPTCTGTCTETGVPTFTFRWLPFH